MIVNCPIVQTEDGRWRCPWCGESNAQPFKKNCPVYRLAYGFRFHNGLGDTLAICAAKRGLNQKPGCDCAWRQQFLNALFPYKPKLWARWLWKAGAFALFPVLILVAVACSLYQWLVGQWDLERKQASQQQELWRRARQQKGR